MKRVRISFWSIILAAMTSIFSVIVFSKKVYFLLHPKMHFICKIAIFVLIILFIESLLSKKSRYKNTFSNIMFMIPIILGFIYITSSPFRGITFNKDIEEHNHIHEHIKNEENEFLRIYGDIQHNEIKVGEAVVLQGIITGENKKYISRVVMSCCAADSQLVGIRLTGKINQKYGEQVCEVEGTITKIDGELAVQLKKIVQIKETNKIYIYR